MNETLIGLKVADLVLWLDAKHISSEITLPTSHKKFLETKPPNGGLVLNLQEGPILQTNKNTTIFDQPGTWQLWKDDQDRYVFVTSPDSPPKRHIIVDKGFTAGQLICEDMPTYPLKEIDIILYINWLANYGDAIIHASGIEINGEGYIFVGESGAGKSTLVKYLFERLGGTILGEDNLILRNISGQFWIFGSPWHQDPDYCSPVGVPLKRLFFLDRNLQPGMMQLEKIEGITQLLKTAFIPYYRIDAVPVILEHFDNLGKKVPFYSLSYQFGTDVWKLLNQV